MALNERRVDRRIEPRIKTEGMVNVTLRMGDLEAEGHLVDLSTRGAYIATGVALNRGIYLQLVFDLPGPRGAQVIRAQVVRSKSALDGRFDSLPAGIGVTFLASDHDERLRVERLVAGLVSLDLLSYDKHKSEWAKSTESIRADDGPLASTSDTRPGA